MRLIVALAALVLSASGPAAVGAPLFDGHIHCSASDWSVYPPERVFAILDQAGIRRALVSSTPDLVDRIASKNIEGLFP